MPNYGGKSPLRMKCPKCSVFDAHPVVKTFRERYKWSDKATELFEKISDRDISFRQRRKRCTSCKREFLSVELSKDYLKDLIDHVHRLDAEWNSLRARNSDQKVEIDRLKDIINRVHTIAAES